jgi:wyosine [tRNA(Phe)-imidazoG37] synthetase (radical SAM superfamily)
MMYKHIFGPVPSRRLGISLGVDLVPYKVCSLNCVYCECGPTSKLTMDRKAYVSFEKVTAELAHYFTNNPEPDYITFSGSGEPTLNARIGDILTFVKKQKPNIPVAVLTNGTLLSIEAVRNELAHADVVLPSLDAATDFSFRKTNRPYCGLTIATYLKGLIDFRRQFKGKVWLETLIIPGYNDGKENLVALKRAFLKIKPDLIQLNTLDRPGAIENIRPANRAALKSIVDFWKLENVEIVSAPVDRKHIHAYREDTETAILETIYRRPCTVHDLANILGTNVHEVNKYLDVLEAENKVSRKRQERGVFYLRSNLN